jgi:hypothetical protein
MTITLRPETEAKLRETAERDGNDVNILADTLLSEGLEARAREHAEFVASLQKELDAAAQGRGKPLAQYVTEQRAKRGYPASWPSLGTATEVEPGVFVANE